MEAFDVCAGCHCHIKRQERRCPFCETPHVKAVLVPRAIPRMSRARWFAFGSTLTLMSCNDSTSKPPSTMDAAAFDTAPSDASFDAPEETSTDGAPDATGVFDAPALDAANDAPDDASNDNADTDAGARDDADAEDIADGGDDANPDVLYDGGRDAGPDGAYFPCCIGDPSSPMCDRRTQICEIWSNPGLECSCTTLDGGALGNFPEQCLPVANCACMDPFFAPWSGTSHTCGCSDDDAGAITVGCGGCYGSPPLRRERWLDPARGVSA